MNTHTTRHHLIVVVKLMLYLMLGAFIYVFISGLLGGNEYGAANSDTMEIDIHGLNAGDYRILNYQGQMVLVLHRNQAMLAQLHANNVQNEKSQTATGIDIYRSQHPTYLIVLANDPVSGCQLVIDRSINGGIRDLCSNNRYDWAGRAITPATVDLTVPDYDLTPQLNGDANIPARP